MNRRTFFAALIALPAALKAVVEAPIIRPSDFPDVGPVYWYYIKDDSFDMDELFKKAYRLKIYRERKESLARQLAMPTPNLP